MRETEDRRNSEEEDIDRGVGSPHGKYSNLGLARVAGVREPTTMWRLHRVYRNFV